MKFRLRIALQFVISIALLAVLLSQIDWSRGLTLIRGADLRWLGAVLAIQVADRLLMALKWHQLLHVLDRRLTRSGAIRVYYESSFTGFALPLGGLGPDIVRFFRLRKQGIDPHVTLTSMLMERLIGIVATLALLVVSLVVLSRLVEEATLRQVLSAAAIGAFFVVTAAVLLMFCRRCMRAVSRLLRWCAAAARVELDKYHEAAGIYASARPVLAGNLMLSIVEQLMPVLAFWAGSRALGAPLPLVACLAVAPVTSIVQRLPISYAGLGLREGSAAAILVALGYDYSEAVVLTMTLFMVFLVSLLPGAAISLLSGRPPVPATAERSAG